MTNKEIIMHLKIYIFWASVCKVLRWFIFPIPIIKHSLIGKGFCKFFIHTNNPWKIIDVLEVDLEITSLYWRNLSYFYITFEENPFSHCYTKRIALAKKTIARLQSIN